MLLEKLQDNIVIKQTLSVYVVQLSVHGVIDSLTTWNEKKRINSIFPVKALTTDLKTLSSRCLSNILMLFVYSF